MLLLDYASVNTPSAVDAHRMSRPFLCGNSRQVLLLMRREWEDAPMASTAF